MDCVCELCHQLSENIRFDGLTVVLQCFIKIVEVISIFGTARTVRVDNDIEGILRSPNGP